MNERCIIFTLLVSCNVDGIISYMKKQAGPSARELANVGAIQKFIDNEEYSIIG